jgi:hypothetical protein
MKDDTLEDLKTQWRRLTSDQRLLERELGRWRLRSYLTMTLELAATAMALVAGGWFLAIAVRMQDLFYGLSGVTLLLACPVAAAWSINLRRQGLHWSDRSPEGTLRYAVTRARTTDRILTMQRWNCIVLLGFVTLVGGCALAGWIAWTMRIALLSCLWIAWACANAVWIKWRRQRNRREELRCEALLSEYAAVATLEQTGNEDAE